jgi:hypothetical protein
VQWTPFGSECSIIIGKGITPTVAGSVQGLHLIVVDIEASRAELVDRDVNVREVFHDVGGIFHLRGVTTMARLPLSVIRTATVGCSKK